MKLNIRHLVINADTVNVNIDGSDLTQNLLPDDNSDFPKSLGWPVPGDSDDDVPFVDDGYDEILDDELPPSPQDMMQNAQVLHSASLDAALHALMFGSDTQERGDCLVQIGNTLFHVSGCGCAEKKSVH